MNRPLQAGFIQPFSVPRTRGDEPEEVEQIARFKKRSPHTRG